MRQKCHPQENIQMFVAATTSNWLKQQCACFQWQHCQNAGTPFVHSFDKFVLVCCCTPRCSQNLLWCLSFHTSLFSLLPCLCFILFAPWFVVFVCHSLSNICDIPNAAHHKLWSTIVFKCNHSIDLHVIWLESNWKWRAFGGKNTDKPDQLCAQWCQQKYMSFLLMLCQHPTST